MVCNLLYYFSAHTTYLPLAGEGGTATDPNPSKEQSVDEVNSVCALCVIIIMPWFILCVCLHCFQTLQDMSDTTAVVPIEEEQ